MTDLETRLAAAMHDHEDIAPSGADVAARVTHLRTRPRSRGRKAGAWLAAAACVGVVATVGGIASFVAANRTDDAYTSGEPVLFTVVDGELQARPVPAWPLSVAAGHPGKAALSALFRQPSTATSYNGWTGDRLLYLAHRTGTWVVNVATTPAVSSRAGVQLVLQQLAWTLSSATHSTGPITIEVGGGVLTSLDGTKISFAGLPDPSVLSGQARGSTWAHTVCGGVQAVEVDGRRTAFLPKSAQKPGDPPTLTMQVGHTLHWLPDGLCFWQGRIMTAAPPFDDFSAGGATDNTWTPLKTGTWMLAYSGYADQDHGFRGGHGPFLAPQFSPPQQRKHPVVHGPGTGAALGAKVIKGRLRVIVTR